MWKRVFGICSAAACLVSGCSSAELTTEEVGQIDQSIVRGTPVPVSNLPSVGRPYVVVLVFRTWSNQIGFCSGTYFGPRVVLTAAHCIPADIRQGFAYWGNNLEADFEQIYEIPPPGQPSAWANLDSWQIHNDYKANPYDADIAVVYLDRKPPFDPLPLYRNRLDASWQNQLATLVGWGANKALTQDISETEGFGVKRTGKAPIVGTPSATDYYAAPDLPGTVNATVRSHYVRTNGTSPNVNLCSGDSGGSLIVNRFGQDYVAGVSSRTGDWCESASLFTRLDPYLPFLDEAYRRGGQALLTPSLDCVDTRPNGKLAAYFGYKNDNGVNVSVPYGSANSLPLDTLSERPSLFKSGNKRFQFGIDFNPGQTLVWKLSPTNSPTTEVRASSASPRCGDTKGRRIARYCEAVLASECIDDFNTNWETCVNTSWDGYDQAANSGCEAPWASWLACVANVAPAEANWSCVPWQDSLPRAVACEPLLTPVFDCLYPQ